MEYFKRSIFQRLSFVWIKISKPCPRLPHRSSYIGLYNTFDMDWLRLQNAVANKGSLVLYLRSPGIRWMTTWYSNTHIWMYIKWRAEIRRYWHWERSDLLSFLLFVMWSFVIRVSNWTIIIESGMCYFMWNIMIAIAYLAYASWRWFKCFSHWRHTFNFKSVPCLPKILEIMSCSRLCSRDLRVDACTQVYYRPIQIIWKGITINRWF